MTRNTKELAEIALRYTTRTALAKADHAAYRAILRHHLAEELFAHMPVPKRYTLAELTEIAKRYTTRTEWLLDHPSSFQAAHRMGAIDDIAPPSLRN